MGKKSGTAGEKKISVQKTWDPLVNPLAPAISRLHFFRQRSTAGPFSSCPCPQCFHLPHLAAQDCSSFSSICTFWTLIMLCDHIQFMRRNQLLPKAVIQKIENIHAQKCGLCIRKCIILSFFWHIFYLDDPTDSPSLFYLLSRLTVGLFDVPDNYLELRTE